MRKHENILATTVRLIPHDKTPIGFFIHDVNIQLNWNYKIIRIELREIKITSEMVNLDSNKPSKRKRILYLP